MLSVSAQLYARILAAPAASALSQAQLFGALLWSVDQGVYEAADLERSLIDTCAASIRVSADSESDAHECIHVVSEPYLQGGHTRLMERLALMHQAPVDLLVTRTADAAVLQRLQPMFGSVHLAEGEQPLQRLQSIVDVLANYTRIVLHIHPDDIIATVACGLLKRQRGEALTVYFVNHADHVFSFGASVADYYFEISAYGHYLDQRKHLTARKSFLGIPIDTATASVQRPQASSAGLKIFSAASAAKYKPHGGLDLRPAIKAILRKYPQAQCWIIGANPLTNTWWWPLKLRYPRRFFMRRHLPYDQFIAMTQQADFYLDSYPIPGGTAFAEQLLRGQRCVGLVAPIQGYSPADALKVDSVERLLTTIGTPQPSQSVIDRVIQVNGVEAVRARYLACLQEGICSRNELVEQLPWTGDLSFMRNEGALHSMIPTQTFADLFALDRGMAVRLLMDYAWLPRVKLLIKFTLHALRNRRQ